MRFAVLAINHRHIYDMVKGLLDAGGICAGFDPTDGEERIVHGLCERFPELTRRPMAALLADPTVDLVAIAGIPAERAGLAIRAMQAGKDAIVDKPGVTSFEQLQEVQAAVAATGRIFSICFTERFLVPATTVAHELIRDGAIGRVVQTIGLGPHRLNRATRPAWFFESRWSGGILTDIASHQIDQFLYFTGSSDAEVVTSAVGHYGEADLPGFEDFGEILLRSPTANGYVRVDWFTADGLPTWGDGRLTILGTEGTIELRKYVDIAGRPGTDHVFLVDRGGTRHIDASTRPLTYFRNLLADVRDRTETAMGQEHVFTVCRLSLEAQAKATRLGPHPTPQ